MSFTFRGAMRATTLPLARLRSIEERVGIVVITSALVFASVSTLWAHDYRADEIEIIHPWARATPQGANVGAGYVVLRNNGSQDDRLVSVAGDIAGRTEIHEMAVDGAGVMTMRPVEGLVIPAGEEIALAPGGYHIMFMDLQAPAREGESFAGSLTFEHAGTVDVEFTVEAMGGSRGHHGHGHGGDQNGHGHD